MFKILLPLIFSEKFFQKLIAWSALGLIIWLLFDFLALFFIIFICAYIFLEAGKAIAQKIHSWGEKGERDTRHRLATKYSTTNIVVTLLYLLFITVVTFIFINIVPKIGTDIQEFITRAPEFAIRGQEFITKIEQAAAVNLGLQETAKEIFSPANFRSIGQFALNNITSGGLILLKFLIGLILSYIFIMERKKIESFLRKMRDGNFAFFYEEYAIIARKIGTGFGMIFRAQAIIALVNAMLTTIGLVIISFMHAGTNFPYIITLSLIVFIFGFIPVFGTIISGVPIIIIAYGFAGLWAVFWVLAMISVVHVVEAYYLNPKIVSSYVHFPVFVTFLILTISEHYFGLIGLLIGVPFFSILIGIIEDCDDYIDTIRKDYSLKVQIGTHP